MEPLTLRSIARRTITAMVANLPNNTRRSVMRVLADGANGYELFQALGRRYGVRDIAVLGDYGVISGSLDDTGVMSGYAQHKTWAAESNRALVSFFEAHNRTGTYIDIGANVGLTTIPVAVFPEVDCKAFEPDPLSHRHLERNISEHCHYGNVEIFNAAVGDRTGMISFEIDASNPGDNRIHVGHRANRYNESARPVIAVASTRLDDQFDPAALKRPLAVKMDVQGAEGGVFAGGERLLAASDLIFFEYWPYSMKRFNADIDALTKFIGRTFPTGSIVTGDHDEPPRWQPIGKVIDIMLERWRLADAEPFVYHEVCLKSRSDAIHRGDDRSQAAPALPRQVRPVADAPILARDQRPSTGER